MTEAEEREAMRQNEIADELVRRAAAMGVDPLMLAARVILHYCGAASGGMMRTGANKPG